MTDFANKVAIVTGSSSGIGASTAIALARQGAKVIIHGRNADALNDVAKKIREVSGQDAVQVIGEMLDETTPKKIVEATLEKFGQIDVLVNNVGMIGLVDNITAPNFMETFDNLMNVNLRSIVNLTHIAVPHLEKTKGNIINVSSIASQLPVSPVYSMTKAALDMFTKSMANQLAVKGIRVNSVNPGPVETNISRNNAYGDAQPTQEQMRGAVSQAVPTGFFAVGDDIANMIVFLANDRLARNVTGSIMFNDSGVLVNPAPLMMMVQGMKGEQEK